MSITSVPFKLGLRFDAKGEVQPTAWFMAGNDPEALAREVCLWGVPHSKLRFYHLPASNQDRSSVGTLVVVPAGTCPDVSHRPHPYQQFGGNLFLPCEARLWPPVLDGELRELLPGHLYVLHPSLGLVGFDKRDCLRLADFLRCPPSRGLSWDAAHPGVASYPCLRTVHVAIPVDPEEFLKESGEEIGTERPDELPPSPKEASNTAADKTVRAIQRGALKALGGAVKGAAGLAGLLGGALGWLATQGAPARGGRRAGVYRGSSGGWLQSASNWIDNKLNAMSESVRASRFKAVSRLLHMLETDLERALKYAIPLSGLPHRGVAPPGTSLMASEVNFSLSNLAGGGPADIWDIDHKYHMRLLEKYRAAADREMALGRYRRAAYVYAHLLGDYLSAAQALKEGKHYREAAALYEKRLNSPLKAAECLVDGGLITEAVAIYERLKMFEKIGELHAKIGNEENSRAAFRKAVKAFCEDENVLEAARVLEKRLKVPDEALGLLASAWPSHTQAEKALTARFALLAKLGRHDDSQALVRSLRSADVQRNMILPLVRCLAHEGRKYADQDTRALALDTTRVVAGNRLRNASRSEASALVHCLTSICPDDRLLDRDGKRYLLRRSRAVVNPSAPKPAIPSREDIEPYETLNLPRGYAWSSFAARGQDIFAGGCSEALQTAVLVKTDLKGDHSLITWEEVAALVGRAPFVLAPDPQKKGPTIVGPRGRMLPFKAWKGKSNFSEPPGGAPPWLAERRLATAYDPSGKLHVLTEREEQLEWHVFTTTGDLVASQSFFFPLYLIGDGLPSEFIVAREQDLWLSAGGLVYHLRLNGRAEFTDHHRQITGIQISPPDSRFRMLVTYDEGAKIIGEDNGRMHESPAAEDMLSPRACFAPDGTVIVASGEEGRVYSTQRMRAEPKATFKLPAFSRVAAVLPGMPSMVGQDGWQFAVATEDGDIHLYRLPIA